MYYWLEIKNKDGHWDYASEAGVGNLCPIENGYTNQADAKADRSNCIGRWTPRGWLRNRDVRVRACPECTDRTACGPIDGLCKAKLLTSAEWQKLKPEITVLNPDGWDRDNFDSAQFSWNEELIDEAEYNKRLSKSTCQWKRK